MKMKRIGYCVAVKVRKRFKAGVTTADETCYSAIDLYNDFADHPDHRYDEKKRAGTAKTIPVYVNEDDLKA